MFRTRSALAIAALCLGLTPGVAPAGNAGLYLAGRQAGMENDHAGAAEYFTRALALDARNPDLMQMALTAQVSLGEFDQAMQIVRRMDAAGIDSDLARLVKLTDWMSRDDYDATVKAFGDGFAVSDILNGFLDELVLAWATLGAGDTEGALAKFDTLGQGTALRNLALYQKALALAMLGRDAEARVIFSGDAEGPLNLSTRGIRAYAEVLSRLGETDAAMQLLTEAYGPVLPPQVADLAAALERGEAVPFDIATDAKGGMGEAFFTLGQVLYGQAGSGLSLVYAQVARTLNPGNADALLLAATILDAQGNAELATDLFDKVPRDHPAFLQAEFGRANALRYSDRLDAAIEVLNQLGKTYPDLMEIQVSLGDALSSAERWDAARAAYDRAVALIGDGSPDDWQIFYARGITLERLGEWPAAEADFRHALDLSPDEPRVLNYLGYSMVEKRINLDEALGMIQKAAAERPEDGYIVDSLGWVLFRLGRYAEAVEPMEQAAALMAIDPVINDHLGDVYWAVGRKLEAQFQWRRALSFVDYGESNEEVDPNRIRRKLELGLDQVLKDEGAQPLIRNDAGGN